MTCVPTGIGVTIPSTLSAKRTLFLEGLRDGDVWRGNWGTQNNLHPIHGTILGTPLGKEKGGPPTPGMVTCLPIRTCVSILGIDLRDGNKTPTGAGKVLPGTATHREVTNQIDTTTKSTMKTITPANR